ncbi:MAG: energy transducer TonB [Gammaproteobacteria bacterium]|nr:energy transducer TonB [Gammaproteobacteria bacterium]
MNAARPIGFAISGLLHVALASLFLLPGAPPVESAPTEHALALDLAMFSLPADVLPEAAPPTLPQAAVAETEPLPQPVPVMAEPPQAEPTPVPKVEVEPAAKPPARKPPERKVVERAEPAPVKPRATIVKQAPHLATSQASPVAREPATEDMIAQRVETAPAIPAVDRDRLRESYLAELAAAIERRKRYPRASRRRGEQGTVVVAFVIQRDGRLVDVTIKQSSGTGRLDEAALKTVQGLESFQPIPTALARDRWSISVPIAFSLR